MEQRMSSEEVARIREAYALAAEAHGNQWRKSGEPYILHPISVARIVAEDLELGVSPVIASLLHDVVEDTDYTIDDIRRMFGDDVAFLVGVVTKQKKEQHEHSKQVDNYRQILASVQFDIRAILIKLADRLHNMRTLDSMRADKQMKIAGETDYFYAPLANRLGLYHVKSELENLSFRYRCPQEFVEIDRQIQAHRAADSNNIGSFTAKIERVLSMNGLPVRIENRYRTAYSVWRKMQSMGCDFQHVDSKHYIRIIYDCAPGFTEKAMSLRIYSVLTDYFKERPGSVSNYINAPKENGYQSFHVKLLNEEQGVWEEIHISSTRMVRNSYLGCAAERTEENVKSWLDRFRNVLLDMAYHTRDMEYMEGVTAAFYYDDIMVFTPEGKVVILPKGATALDFAFEIHSEVGLHAVYARINGKLQPVKTVLHRGDCVEIGVDEKAAPLEDWLNHVMTYKSKRHLRTYFSRQPRLDYIRCPRCCPLPGEDVVGFRTSENEPLTLHKRNCTKAIRLASEQGDSIVSVDFQENPRYLYPVKIRIRGIDRFHLLRDLIDCITEHLQLSILGISTDTSDRIAECTIDFSVHSAAELRSAMHSLGKIEGVDEVSYLSERSYR